MKRAKLTGAILLSLASLAACSPGEVIVLTEVDMENATTGEREPMPLVYREIELIPFDRDAIFDSLTAVASSPEPQLPQDLLMARDSSNAARLRFQAVDADWVAIQERLLGINNEMARYAPAETAYRRLFDQYRGVQNTALGIERRRTAELAHFDSIQQVTSTKMEEFGALKRAWENQAFASYADILEEKVDDVGRDILYDTTDASGAAQFAPSPGPWWIYTRLTEGADELYWNLPVSVERGTPAEVRLNRGNAEVRPIF
ncbi:MAG: hypothetical protein EXR92_00625 [Gemmatimonadetes bacterium]|nr:hypothetical protein [Gemmatimonadota bacterium]